MKVAVDTDSLVIGEDACIVNFKRTLRAPANLISSYNIAAFPTFTNLPILKVRKLISLAHNSKKGK